MIVKIEGKLEKLEPYSAVIQLNGIGYEVMLPPYCVNQLSDKIGTDIVICTMQYFEGSPGGGNSIPRLIGFLNSDERDFFKKYTGIKGMGIKKAMKSLTLPVETIAAAIENADEKTLNSLAGIGKKMSKQIINELKGKVRAFAGAMEKTAAERTQLQPYQVEALEILIAWGEKRNEMIELIQLAEKKHPDVQTAEELVPIIYRLKQGVEV